MNFRNISAWCIRNPMPPIVLFVGLMLAGLLAFTRLPITLMPDIEFPGAFVIIAQPGAAPSELETQVAQKVEAALRNLNGIEDINSTINEGSAQIGVRFVIGTPIDRAVNDIRDAVANVRSELPDGIMEPQVRRFSTADQEVAIFTVESSDMTLEQLSWYVDNTINKRLRSLSYLGGVDRLGGSNREIRIVLDPARMQSYGLTAAQVNAQLRQTNVNAAGGRTEIGDTEQAIRVVGNAKNAYDLGQTPISAGGGRILRLTDIADVRDQSAEQRSIASLNGRQVLAFSIKRSPGGSDVSVYEAAAEELKKIETENPKVKFKEIFSVAPFAKSQYSSSMEAMIEGAVLAVLVVLIFLRDWRATLISSIAIPLSAIPCFFFMQWMNFSLNTMTLMALGLVAGVLVDDAIVEIENIVRHMRMGKSAFQASIDAADEIGLAVLATTMAIVAVFLPVGLMPGTTGEFFKNFGLTIVASVLFSLLVARMITPLVAAYFLKSKGQQAHASGKWMDVYLRILKWSLKNRLKTVGIGMLSFAVTVLLVTGIPALGIKSMGFQTFPDTNDDFLEVMISTPPGTTLEDTVALADKVQNMLVAEKTIVKSAFASIRPTSATVFVTLKEDRTLTSIAFKQKLGPTFAQIPNARVYFQADQGGGPPGSGRDLGITLGSDDPVLLSKTSATLAAQMTGIKELVAPRVEGDTQRPEVIVKPRMDLAASLGVTTAALSQTIRIATIGDIDQNSPKFSLSDRQVPIRVTLSEESRKSLSTLENLPVPTASGGSVPLKSVAEISFGEGPTTIRRTNLIRRLVITADFGKGVVASVANEKVDALPIMKNLPSNIVKIETTRDKQSAELARNFFIALVSGILLVFSVLVLLYRRLVSPLVNMGSLILAPLGSMIALRIAGMPITMPVMIGLLMLFGIVAKNSILVVDFAIEEMEQRGTDKLSAIIEAGHKRAQPIVMTTVAMVAGMIPTALAVSGSGAWRQPTGVVVIGGLIVSTLLTLLIVPAGFSLALGVEARLGPWLGYWLTNHGETEMTERPHLLPNWLKHPFRRRPAVLPAE